MTTQTSDVILERMMSLHPKIIDLTLDRVWRLLSALGDPQKSLPPVVHVAGTNGKGSTLAMIRAGMEGAGLAPHVYTSPHLARFHERIRLAGRLISEPALTAILDDCYVANGDDPITYFEITTIAGLLAFARTPADFTLLETGLGGRLDATNVVPTPAMTIITPISIDHQQYLGETLIEIAKEKAGILKAKVPCIVGKQDDQALGVIESAAAGLMVPLSVHGQHWQVWEERGRLIFQDERGLLDLPLPVLPGNHQIENAGIALAALRGLGIGEKSYETAMTDADWPARMQRLRNGPLVSEAVNAELWLDGGHNPAAGDALAAHMATLPDRPTYLICGMLNTKDIAGYLGPLARISKNLTAVSIPGEVNTLPAEETAAAAQSVGFKAQTAGNVLDAVQTIVTAEPNARILICGSLYLAGNILRENG